MNPKKTIQFFSFLIIVLLRVGPVHAQLPSNQEELNRLKADVYYLADDKLKGRLTGTKGAKLASKYICNSYKESGLTPLIGNSYLHAFDYTYSPNPHGGHSAKKKNITGKNVVGFLDNGANKTILVGAHYDHLGGNEHHNSTDPNSAGEIHNGADDNASGVAILLELARSISTTETKENANYIFACFSGEEDGLIGSKALAKHIQENDIQLDMMINMDMVGRLNSEGSIIVSGVGTSPRFVDLVKNNTPPSLKLTMDSSGVGPTDHTSFYLNDYPVLSFFTGSHSDYHKPTDKADKINYPGMVTLNAYIYAVINALDRENSYPFTKTKVKDTKKVPRYKVTLGVMPDYADYGNGLHLDAITEGRPADIAGLKSGDIVMQIGECKIKEVYSYMGCLAKFHKGDTVLITYKRGDQIRTTKLTF
jgi:hypothetical protein